MVTTHMRTIASYAAAGAAVLITWAIASAAFIHGGGELTGNVVALCLIGLPFVTLAVVYYVEVSWRNVIIWLRHMWARDDRDFPYHEAFRPVSADLGQVSSKVATLGGLTSIDRPAQRRRPGPSIGVHGREGTLVTEMPGPARCHFRYHPPPRGFCSDRARS
jgi:hypothetical protein